MGAKRVVAPDGRVWTVGRRWIGDRPRLRREREPDSTGVGGGDEGSLWGDLLAIDDITPAGIVAGLAITVALILVFAVAWPLVAVALEVVVVVLAAAVGLVGRLLFRRPWTVYARAEPRRLEWHVPGWRASGELIDEIAERLAGGEDPRQIED
jgi:hypothetical protein